MTDFEIRALRVVSVVCSAIAIVLGALSIIAWRPGRVWHDVPPAWLDPVWQVYLPFFSLIALLVAVLLFAARPGRTHAMLVCTALVGLAVFACLRVFPCGCP
jgi:cytochrome bd-type quinol oxidase subunit 2